MDGESFVKITKPLLKSILKDCAIYEESLKTFLNFTSVAVPFLHLSETINNLQSCAKDMEYAMRSCTTIAFNNCRL